MAIWWIRKGIRLHDNPTLAAALASNPSSLLPVFVLDPHFSASPTVSPNRWNFLHQCLLDLHTSLKGLSSALYIARGTPEQVLPSLASKTGSTAIYTEQDTEPYALKRDQAVQKALSDVGVKLVGISGHTMLNPWSVAGNASEWPESPASLAGVENGSLPKTYQSLVKTFGAKMPGGIPLPAPTAPLPAIPTIPSEMDIGLVPKTLDEMLPEKPPGPWWDPEAAFVITTKTKGGESEGLRLLAKFVSKPKRVMTFEKPKTDATGAGSTTALSPYIKFGALSARHMFKVIDDVMKASSGTPTAPPVSLHGQLLWREFFYLHSALIPGFEDPGQNPLARDIPWKNASGPTDDGAEFLTAWAMSKTGFPWIDAIMNELRTTGWLHHLARHSVACFLTRGDGWVHWKAVLMDSPQASGARARNEVEVSVLGRNILRARSSFTTTNKYRLKPAQ